MYQIKDPRDTGKLLYFHNHVWASQPSSLPRLIRVGPWMRRWSHRHAASFCNLPGSRAMLGDSHYFLLTSFSQICPTIPSWFSKISGHGKNTKNLFIILLKSFGILVHHTSRNQSFQNFTFLTRRTKTYCFNSFKPTCKQNLFRASCLLGNATWVWMHGTLQEAPVWAAHPKPLGHIGGHKSFQTDLQNKHQQHPA